MCVEVIIRRNNNIYTHIRTLNRDKYMHLCTFQPENNKLLQK